MTCRSRLGTFGIASQGTFQAGSREARVTERIPPLLAAFLEAAVPADILPLTAAEICKRLEAPNPFWNRIRREAIILAGSLPGFSDI